MNRVESFFGMIGHDVKAIANWVGSHQKQIDGVGQAVAAGIGIVDPPLGAAAALIEQVGEKLFGKAVALLHDTVNVTDAAQKAASADGANIVLDAALIQQIKEAIKAIEALKPGTLGTAKALVAASTAASTAASK